jgi:hypothetical protein
MTSVSLLSAEGEVTSLDLREPVAASRPTAPLSSRTAYAAAHVVPKAWGENVPGAPADLDWDATLAYRHHVWSFGLGVADAMDTAQRNMGLDTAATRELITRSAAEAASVGGALVVGVNTDHLAEEEVSLDTVADAYLEQLAFAEDAGAGTVLMASRHLARAAQGADDYRRIYDRVLSAAQSPVVLHWLGTAFDPSLAGYFGSTDVAAASDTLLQIMTDNVDHVAGVKMSLLDADAEIAVRRRLPSGATMFTGDDFNYVDLIAGRAARRVHGDRAGGLRGDPGPRRGRPRRVRTDPPPDRGPVPPDLRRTHLLLQDGHRLPELAERAPAGVLDGRRPARGAEPAAPVRDRPSGRHRRGP